MNTLTLLVCTLCSLGAATEAAKPYTIGQYHKMHSKVLNEERGYCVYLPPDYESSTDSYPVLYMLDGHRHFHYASGLVDYLSRYPKVIPSMIIVDIEQSHRSRDMTPTPSAERPADTGQADRFLTFLHKELIPHINSQYRTKAPRIIVGYSISGLFAIYALQTRPETFDAYIVSSPSIWWDDHLLLKQAQPFFEKRKTLDKFLYFGVGGQERQVVQDYFDRFQEIVTQHKPTQFRVVMHRFEEEAHNTICLPVFYHGIKAAFAPTEKDN